MALVSQCKCESPRLVKNKYTGQDVYVYCGKCLSCRRAHQAAWVTKLQRESKCHLYTMELQLDYNESSLPKYDFSSDGESLIEITPRLDNYYKKYPHLKKIDLKDLNFETDADRDYFIDRINGHHTCIPHAAVYDIQLFKKRLNTLIKRQVTGKYGEIRSAIVSELGGQTLRPHMHGILFFDDERICQALPSLVAKAWVDECGRSLGHARVAPDRGKFASYLSKYVSKSLDIPSFYEHPALRPFFLTSRKPPLGSLYESSSEVRWVFDNATPVRVEFQKQGELWCPKPVPIGQNFENRLFPKCLGYGKIADFERVALYKCAHSQNGLKPYNLWLNEFFNRVFVSVDNPTSGMFYIKDVFRSYALSFLHNKIVLRNSDFSYLIKHLSRDFECERTFQQIYNVSARVYRQSQILNVFPDYYIKQILKYHNVNKPRFLLREFYNLQNQVCFNFKNYNYEYFYPLSYFYTSNPCTAPDAKLYYKHMHDKHVEDMKTMEKNDYFEKLRVKDNPLYVILKKYKDAKKCYENVEAVT